MPTYILTTLATPGSASWVDVSTLVTVGGGIQTPVTLVPADTLTLRWFPLREETISKIEVYFTTAPTTAGVYTLEVKNVAVDLLDVGAFDLTSVVATTRTGITLTTAAPASLDVTSADVITFTMTSNNSDLAGAGFSIIVTTIPTP